VDRYHRGTIAYGASPAAQPERSVNWIFPMEPISALLLIGFLPGRSALAQFVRRGLDEIRDHLWVRRSHRAVAAVVARIVFPAGRCLLPCRSSPPRGAGARQRLRCSALGLCQCHPRQAV
jgi:hypothetical protein